MPSLRSSHLAPSRWIGCLLLTGYLDSPSNLRNLRWTSRFLRTLQSNRLIAVLHSQSFSLILADFLRVAQLSSSTLCLSHSPCHSQPSLTHSFRHHDSSQGWSSYLKQPMESLTSEEKMRKQLCDGTVLCSILNMLLSDIAKCNLQYQQLVECSIPDYFNWQPPSIYPKKKKTFRTNRCAVFYCFIS